MDEYNSEETGLMDEHDRARAACHDCGQPTPDTAWRCNPCGRVCDTCADRHYQQHR